MIFRQFAYRNVVRNMRIYAAFFMASVFSVMVFFLYSMLLYHPSIENRFVEEIAFTGMVIAELILYIFTWFFLFYSMRAFLQARSKEFGILLHLGMAKRQLHRLIFIETMIIGIGSIVAGTFLGYMFSKFFFMIVRNIVQLPALPLYLSWEPFALTVGAFLSLFVIISLLTPYFIQTGQVSELMQGELSGDRESGHQNARAYIGVFFLAAAYLMAAATSYSIVIGLIFLLPPLATIGTYFFFTDSLPMILHNIRKRKKYYWHHFWLLSLSEGVVRLRENARMFFIVTIVSTIAFMSVGILASLSSFASQYREMNPLGLVYKSGPGNELESQHVNRLVKELQEEEIGYTLVAFHVLQQKSSYTNNPVNVLKQADINALAASFQYESLHLKKGEAVFLPPTPSSVPQLETRRIHTVLEESNIPVFIEGAYTHQLFSSYAMGLNPIILNDADYEKLAASAPAKELAAFTYYAFNIPNWQATKDIGLLLEAASTDSYLNNSAEGLFYDYVNPGLNYSVIRTTFSLLLFIGLLLAAVFLLAAGSFIYFRLYTTLDRDRKQFDVLRRMGITDKEFKKIINRQLIPQFFFPWGVALVHSSFAFLSLQVIWDELVEISIAKELTMVLAGFTIMQIIYFYLIRWRYLAHIKTAA